MENALTKEPTKAQAKAIIKNVAFWITETQLRVREYTSIYPAKHAVFETNGQFDVELYLMSFFRFILDRYTVQVITNGTHKKPIFVQLEPAVIAELKAAVAKVLSLPQPPSKSLLIELAEGQTKRQVGTRTPVQDKTFESEHGYSVEIRGDGLDGLSYDPDVAHEYQETIEVVGAYIIDPEVFKACVQREVPRSHGQKKVLEDFTGLCTPKIEAKPTSALIAAMPALRKSCPNFVAVIDDLARYFVAQKATGTATGFMPILLVGAPGIGKTHFVNVISSVMGVSSKFINLSGARDSLKIKGISQSWGQSHPGSIARFMADSEHFNPIIVLDEIDKCGTQMSAGEPLDEVLLPLLERETSAAFEDDYIGVGMDLSRVSWIATCNSVEEMSPAMLSRMDVYYIDPPTRNQQRTILGNLHRGIRRDHGFECLHGSLSDDVTDALICTGLSMRELRREIYKAQCNAIVRIPGGVGIELAVEDIPGAKRDALPSRSIGFTASM